MVKKKQTSKNKREQEKQSNELLDDHRKAPSNITQFFLTKFDRYQALFLALLIFVGFIIYSNTLNSPFVFDDIKAIKENHFIRTEELSWRNIINAATGYGKSRPVSNLTFAFNYYFGRYNVVGYHLVNILISIINGILLFFLLKITLTIYSRQRFVASKLDSFTVTSVSFCTALLWLAHPVQTQSVTYIVQRMNSMGAMFFILALLLYAKGRLSQHRASQISDIQDKNERQKKHSSYCYYWFLGCALAGVLAFGSKESNASLPFFIFLYEWYFFQDLDMNWLKRSLKYIVLIAILFGLFALISLGLEPLEKLKSLRDFSAGQFTMDQRLLTQTRVVVYYLSLLVYPHPSRLNLDYDFPLSYSLIDPFTTLPALIIIVGLVILGIYLAKSQRLISFCIFWFFGNLVIESSVIPLALIFEHRLYLPSMLLFLIPVTLGYRYIKLIWLRAGLLCLAVVVLSVWTYQRNQVWENELTLWTDVVKKSPNKARPQVNLGLVLANQDRLDEAIQHYIKSIQLDPNFAETYNNLGVVLKNQGKLNEAIQHYRKALQINPTYADAHNNLGVVLEKQGKPSEAKQHYRKALVLNPNHLSALNNLGNVLSKEGEANEAIEHFRRALQLDPDNSKVHNNLALVLVEQGQPNEAIRHYRKALELNPDNDEAHNNLALILAAQGKTHEAVGHYRRALQINPNYAEAHNNLGGALLRQGNIDEAREHFTAALDLDPNLAQAHSNMGVLLIQKGEIEAAIPYFREALRITPDSSSADANLKRALAIQKNVEEKTAMIQEALNNNPDDPLLHFEMGNIFLGKGEFRKAIRQFEKALSMQPQFAAAQYNLALAYAADKQYDKALTAFKKMTALQPDNANTYYNTAVLFAMQNNVEESIAWLKKAIDKGYSNWELIKTDKDLENIRNSTDYMELLKNH